MGKTPIERGSTRHLDGDAAADRAAVRQRVGEATAACRRRRPWADASATVPASYAELLREPAERDPRGYILPADQPDFLTATKFVNALMKTGVDGAPRHRRLHRRRQEVPGRLVSS